MSRNAHACPSVRFALAWSRMLHMLCTLLSAGAVAALTGCLAAEEPDAAGTLRQSFPDQAAQVLEGSEAFVARDDGFSTDSKGDVEAALRRRGKLTIALPASAEEGIRFHLPGGFEVRVREQG